jgi:hypothetical protein
VQKNNRKAHKVFHKVRKEYYKISPSMFQKIRFNQRLTQSIRFIRVPIHPTSSFITESPIKITKNYKKQKN